MPAPGPLSPSTKPLSRMRFPAKTFAIAAHRLVSFRNSTPGPPFPVMTLWRNWLSVSLWPMEMPAPCSRYLIVLEQPVLDAPADVEAIAAVVHRAVAADNRLRRSRSRVQAEPGIRFAQAIFNRDPLGDLETNAVAVVAADDTVADSEPPRTRTGRSHHPGNHPVAPPSHLSRRWSGLPRQRLHVPAADHREDQASRGPLRDQIIEVQRCGEAKRPGIDLFRQGGRCDRETTAK